MAIYDLFTRALRMPALVPQGVPGDLTRGEDRHSAQFWISRGPGGLISCQYRCSSCTTLIALCQYICETLEREGYAAAYGLNARAIVAHNRDIAPSKTVQAQLAVEAFQSACRAYQSNYAKTPGR